MSTKSHQVWEAGKSYASATASQPNPEQPASQAQAQQAQAQRAQAQARQAQAQQAQAPQAQPAQAQPTGRRRESTREFGVPPQQPQQPQQQEVGLGDYLHAVLSEIQAVMAANFQDPFELSIGVSANGIRVNGLIYGGQEPGEPPCDVIQLPGGQYLMAVGDPTQLSPEDIEGAINWVLETASESIPQIRR